MPAELGKISENALLDNSGVARQQKNSSRQISMFAENHRFLQFLVSFSIVGFCLILRILPKPLRLICYLEV